MSDYPERKCPNCHAEYTVIDIDICPRCGMRAEPSEIAKDNTPIYNNEFLPVIGWRYPCVIVSENGEIKPTTNKVIHVGLQDNRQEVSTKRDESEVKDD